MDTCILGIGVRSFDLIHARAVPGGRFESEHLVSEPVALDASIDATGGIGSRAWADALRLAGKLIAKGRRAAQSGHVVALAPHGLGGAENAHGFALAVRRRFGAQLAVVPVADTAQLAYRAAHHELDAGSSAVAAIHVGDLTIDFTAGSGATNDFFESMSLGVVKLHRAYGATDSGFLATDAGALFSLIRLCGGPACRKLRDWGDVAPVFGSENAAAVRDVARAWGYMDRASTSLERLALHALVPEILSAPPDRLGVDPRRASSVGTTAVVIDALSDVFGLRDVRIASLGVLEGAALEVLAPRAPSFGATGTESRRGYA
jgi:exopolyphosphatase/pppGpp-phosphohydrolase